MNERSAEYVLRIVTLMHGPYVAYAIVMGEEGLRRAEEFHNWVMAHPAFAEKYEVPDLYDLWMGVPERSL